MIEIDGSYLEGGGQIARTAISLSAITNEPCRIFNIRKGRPNPGLKPQHLSAIQAASKICNGNLKGCTVGSTEIEFCPGKIEGGNHSIDIGTAGSVTLVLQTLIPICLNANKKSVLEITGGTHVPYSPSADYFQHVFCEFIKKVGLKISFETERVGFYPKGGGKVKLEINNEDRVLPLFLSKRGELENYSIYSIASDELKHAKVTERQILGAEKIIDIKNEYASHPITKSTGSHVHINAKFENCVLGADLLGEKGKLAEKVGEECAIILKKQINSDACLDRWMADQILIYMALAEEGEVSVSEITNHVLTNIWTIEKFLPVKFEVKGEKGQPGIIKVIRV